MMIDDLFDLGGVNHACRYCSLFRGGECINTDICSNSTDYCTVDSVIKVAEDGYLAGAIEEALRGCNTREFEERIKSALVKFRLSGISIDFIMDALKGVYEEYIEKCTSVLDDAVSRLYANHVSGEQVALEIKDPATFYCRDFQ